MSVYLERTTGFSASDETAARWNAVSWFLFLFKKMCLVEQSPWYAVSCQFFFHILGHYLIISATKIRVFISFIQNNFFDWVLDFFGFCFSQFQKLLFFNIKLTFSYAILETIFKCVLFMFLLSKNEKIKPPAQLMVSGKN